MRPAILGGSLLLPIEAIPLEAVKKALTVSYRPMGEEPVRVFAYQQIPRSKHIAVPRQYGLKLAAQYGIEIDDRTALGEAVIFPRIPEPRTYQIEFLESVMTSTERYYDIIAKAHTGFGKTISAMIIAARVGRTTVVIVDQTNLRDQWLEPLEEHFGMTIENGHIGIIQGSVCDYQGKSVVLAMIQTLSQRRLVDDVYRYFGTAIFDEVHITGAPTFSTVLKQFPATLRIGVSATPTRRDELKKLVTYNLGPVRVAAEKEHAESSVYVLRNETTYSWYGNISPKVGRIISEVSEDGSRNLLMADILAGLLENGRDVIAMSDRIDHLNDIKNLLHYMGVDESTIGLYTGRQPYYSYTKDATPSRRPYGLVKGASYTPITLQLIARKIPKARLGWVKQKASLILSTYGMTAKAFDEPRLSAGMDLTPRSTAEQIQGRILREKVGKKKPIWVTVLDFNNYRLVYSFIGRLADYPKSNSRVFDWNKNGDLTECLPNLLTTELRDRVTLLKGMRIATRSDGTNTLTTSKDVKKKTRQDAIDTVKRIRG